MALHSKELEGSKKNRRGKGVKHSRNQKAGEGKKIYNIHGTIGLEQQGKGKTQREGKGEGKEDFLQKKGLGRCTKMREGPGPTEF